VLPKVELKGRDPDDAYDRVTGAMQRALNGLDDERSIPVVG
jgi:hypothetical protein